MRIVNTNRLGEESISSPKGRFACSEKAISEALGRKPLSTDMLELHPFDVAIVRVPPDKRNWPYHSHSAQWEFYHVISGAGKVRDEEGLSAIEPGDAFIFEPGKAHQIINDGAEDLVLYLIADNPPGGSTYYPDSQKWAVRLPERRIIRSEPLDYFDGEE
ncbi:MAG TPA: cupin domain-containing protein [Candidatus Cybelea sp.]|jgi:uncharacterized cupin superfamily protein|nr:cupin domain-containing protein [Candidatus Cybelea sp.]